MIPVPHRKFKGNSISVIGVGGRALGDVGDSGEVQRIVDEALDRGINFF
ncbi:MAG: aldo/keto reductase, partial [Candidatus Eremiobacteraeota bacterium]|nr:aldo/keto reductase [Candidatus Eremiobacteraeota bacterium]